MRSIVIAATLVLLSSSAWAQQQMPTTNTTGDASCIATIGRGAAIERADHRIRTGGREPAESGYDRRNVADRG